MACRQNCLKAVYHCHRYFEPEVVMHTSINEDVRLTLQGSWLEMICTIRPPLTSGQILSVAGALEPEAQTTRLYYTLI